MNIVGAKARRAFEEKVNTVIKNKVLSKYAELLGKEKKLILKQNLKDVNYARKIGVKNNLISRLMIDENKLKIFKIQLLKFQN
jgi:glutamate-5-semialdehyde dehydrogenase